MTSASEAAARLAEIDSLQDEVLERLAELEQRCEAVLASCQSVGPAVVPLPETGTAPRKTKRKAA